VLHDEAGAVGRDESRLVSRRQALLVSGHRSKEVDTGERVLIGGCRKIEVGVEERRTVKADASGAGGSDALWTDGGVEVQIGGGRTVHVEGNEQASFREGRVTSVRGHASSQATVTRLAEVGDEMQVRQGASSLSLTAGRARLAPESQLAAINRAGALVLDAQGEAVLMMPRIRLSCGASQLAIGDGRIAISAATVVARGAAGTVTLDAQGAATAGLDVSSSAVMLNEIRGLPVIFSDRPGNTGSGGTP
jgi:hypothetical protein